MNGIVIFPILQVRRLGHMGSVSRQVLRTYAQQILSWGLGIRQLNKADKALCRCGNPILTGRSKQ